MLILGQICWLGAPNKSLTPGNCFNDGSLSWNGFIASQLSKLVCGLFTFSLLETRWFSNHGPPGPRNYTLDAVCFIAKENELHPFLLPIFLVLLFLVYIWQNSKLNYTDFIDFVKILQEFLNIFWLFHLTEPIHSNSASTMRPKSFWRCINISYDITRYSQTFCRNLVTIFEKILWKHE